MVADMIASSFPNSPRTSPTRPGRTLAIRCAALALAGLVMGVLGAAAPSEQAAATAAEAAIPEEIRNELQSAMQAKIKQLLADKNEDGTPFKRGTYSKSFKQIDENTYETAFHRNTVQKDDSLLTERFQVTLKRDPANSKWSVASEDLQDTYTALYRIVASERETYQFDSLTIDREGMKVTASKGTLNKRFIHGKPAGFLVAASDLSYEYNPPERREEFIKKKEQLLYEKLKRDKESDVIFKPDYVQIGCDAVSCEELLSGFTGLRPVTMDQADPVLRKQFDIKTKEIKKKIKEDAFFGLDRPTEPDRRTYSIDFRKESPDRRVMLQFDSYEPEEVSYWVWNPDKVIAEYTKIYHYISKATRESTASLYDIERRDDSDARDYDLTALKGTVELAIEDSETLTADATFTLTTKRELREIPFFIARIRRSEEEKKEARDPQMSINSIEDGTGREMTWVKTSAASGIVILPKPVPAGTKVFIRIQLENKAAIYHLSPTFSYVTRFGWLPFVRFTDPITDFDLTIKAPARYQVLGIGRKVADEVKAGVRATQWIADSPVEFPSITYGDYIDRPASEKATRADGSIIPVYIHADKLGKLPSAAKFLEELANQAATALNLYRGIYGTEYPYGKLDLVNDPFGQFYGQSPSSLIYLGNGVFLGQGRVGDMGGGQLSKFNRDVVAHEVAHQWWGSLTPNFNESNYWFVESLAEYSAGLYIQESEGIEAYRIKAADWRREVLDAELLASVQDAPVVWAGDSLGRSYRAAVYAKGPYIFHIMRHTWGDEKFYAFLKSLSQELKGKAVITRDIQKVAEKSFGGNMDFFFDEWIRGVGLPEYTFSVATRQTEDGKYLIEGTVKQRVLLGRKKDLLDGQYFRAVVPITVTSKDGKELRYPLLVQGAETPFKFKANDLPKDIVLNKYGEALAFDVIKN